MKNRSLAILAAISASTIYGINHTIAKGVMPNYVQPYGFILLRIIGGSILFWCISFFGPKEKIKRKDFLTMLLCAALGMGFNMLTFFKGLSLSTPINSAVLVTIIPIIVIVLSAFFLKERISNRKIFGVLMAFVGALGLILLGAEIRQDAPNIPLGNFLILLNAIFYAIFLIVAKKLITKYHLFTFMKWSFTLGIFICLPFGYQELVEVEWVNMPSKILSSISFVILGTTFCAFLFNVFALRHLRASTMSAFIYLEPFIGILFAVVMGQDSFTTVKIVATFLVLLGIYLASRRPIMKVKSSQGKVSHSQTSRD